MGIDLVGRAKRWLGLGYNGPSDTRLMDQIQRTDTALRDYFLWEYDLIPVWMTDAADIARHHALMAIAREILTTHRPDTLEEFEAEVDRRWKEAGLV